MANSAQKTKVLVNGVDISSEVFSVIIRRLPGGVEEADLNVYTSKLEVDEEGVLTVHIDTPKEDS